MLWVYERKLRYFHDLSDFQLSMGDEFVSAMACDV